MKRKTYTVRLIVLLLLSLLFVFPVVMTLINSLRYGESVITLRQYWELFVTNFTYLDYFWNSVIYASLTTAVCIIISLPLGFVFAKIPFKLSLIHI